MNKDTNVLLIVSLLGSAVLSLLVSLALVLIFMIRQKERKEHDSESFKVRAMKESREFGLLSPPMSPTEVRRTQQPRKNSKQLDTAFLSANAKEKKGGATKAIATAAAAASTSASATKPPSASASKSNQLPVFKKSGRETQLNPQERLKKHQEVTRWREEHDRTISGNWGQLQRNPVPPTPVSPLPSFNSEETGSESSDSSDP